MILTEDLRKLNMIEKNAVITLTEEIGIHALLLYYELKKKIMQKITYRL